jgi:hypothetical protein
LFPDICAKTENGFVATGNCFFVPPATKQWTRKSNDFNQTMLGTGGPLLLRRRAVPCHHAGCGHYDRRSTVRKCPDAGQVAILVPRQRRSGQDENQGNHEAEGSHPVSPVTICR